MSSKTGTRNSTRYDNELSGSPVHLAAARRAVGIAFGAGAQREFTVRFWDGSEDGPVSGSRFTLSIRRAGALRRAMLPPSELGIVEAYLRDDIDVEENLEAAGILSDVVAGRLRSPLNVAALVRVLRTLPTDDLPSVNANSRRASLWDRLRGHTRAGDAEQVRHHYDVGNDFYALWLDPRMLYSCAYFPTGAESLDEAQEAKLKHICRKLRLKAGERLLDVGCGWGGMLEYAATRFGVSGVGITLSEPQAVVARERLARAGVGDRVRIEVRDYRDLDPTWQFDKAVSVGMREHVGAKNLPAYYGAVERALVSGGLFLDHGIVRGGSWVGSGGLVSWLAHRLWRRDAFIEKYVFPGGELVPLGELIAFAERAGLEARDVENLREHYALTLRAWVANLEKAHVQAASMVGEHTYRVWRLYMAATTLGFASGRLTLIQTLLAKSHPDGSVALPPSRDDIYRLNR